MSVASSCLPLTKRVYFFPGLPLVVLVVFQLPFGRGCPIEFAAALWFIVLFSVIHFRALCPGSAVAVLWHAAGLGPAWAAGAIHLTWGFPR